MLLAREPNRFRQIAEKIDYRRAAELKGAGLHQTTDGRHISQVDMYLEARQKACPHGLIQTLKIEK